MGWLSFGEERGREWRTEDNEERVRTVEKDWMPQRSSTPAPSPLHQLLAVCLRTPVNMVCKTQNTPCKREHPGNGRQDFTPVYLHHHHHHQPLHHPNPRCPCIVCLAPWLCGGVHPRRREGLAESPVNAPWKSHAAVNEVLARVSGAPRSGVPGGGWQQPVARYGAAQRDEAGG